MDDEKYKERMYDLLNLLVSEISDMKVYIREIKDELKRMNDK